MARACPFRSLLLEIDDGLTKEDLDKLIFLSKDEIGSERESEDISSGRDLFEVFIKRDLINKECIDYLADLLVKIRRFDLRKVINKKWDVLRKTCVDDTTTNTTGTKHSLQIGLMVEGVCLQEQTKEIPVMHFLPDPHIMHTVPEVQIDGQAVDYIVHDGKQSQGEGNQQRKESIMPPGIPGLSAKCATPDVSSHADTIRRGTDEKRPPSIQQQCVELGSTENSFNNYEMPIGRHSYHGYRDKNYNSPAVGNRSSSFSMDSLEEQNFLEVRIGRHLSPKSSFDSGSSTFSVDSLEEPKALNRTIFRKTRKTSFQSHRSSTISTISTDSLEEQCPEFLEQERGV